MLGVLGSLASTFLPKVISWGAKKLGGTQLGKTISGAASSRLGKTMINSAKNGWKGYNQMKKLQNEAQKQGQPMDDQQAFQEYLKMRKRGKMTMQPQQNVQQEQKQVKKKKTKPIAKKGRARNR